MERLSHRALRLLPSRSSAPVLRRFAEVAGRRRVFDTSTNERDPLRICRAKNCSLWGSRSRPERVTCRDRQPGMIASVSLRLLYLIFSQLLSWPTLLPRAPSSKDIELL